MFFLQIVRICKTTSGDKCNSHAYFFFFAKGKEDRRWEPRRRTRAESSLREVFVIVHNSLREWLFCLLCSSLREYYPEKEREREGEISTVNFKSEAQQTSRQEDKHETATAAAAREDAE